MSDDERWMSRALALAERGRGHVEPNPLVGAVLVRESAIVGEGWHERFGGPHAEIVALAAAGERARGATLYVTLEPCCHFGKTPPCTRALVAAGVVRVVAAMGDPFPEVAGEGIAELRGAGIAVRVGVGAFAAARLNKSYRMLLARGRPYVHAKWAMSLDGKIATSTGESQWISGPEARQRVHELRGRMDAIIVGSGTVRADDPLLTVRPKGPRRATRVVLSRSGTLPTSCRLLQSLNDAPVIVTSTGDSPPIPGVETLVLPGVETLMLPCADERVPITALLRELGHRGMTNVMVEGGATTLGEFFDADAIDEIHVFIAGLVIGGLAAPSPIAGAGRPSLTNARRLIHWTHESWGADCYAHGWFVSADSRSV